MGTPQRWWHLRGTSSEARAITDGSQPSQHMRPVPTPRCFPSSAVLGRRKQLRAARGHRCRWRWGGRGSWGSRYGCSGASSLGRACRPRGGPGAAPWAQGDVSCLLPELKHRPFNRHQRCASGRVPAGAPLHYQLARCLFQDTVVKLHRAGAVIWGFLSCQPRRQIGRGGAREGERNGINLNQQKEEQGDAHGHPCCRRALLPQAVGPVGTRAGCGGHRGVVASRPVSASSGGGAMEVP